MFAFYKNGKKIESKFFTLFRYFVELQLCVFDWQLDISLSPVFYKWLLGQEHCLTSADLQNIDPTLYKSFSQLEELLRQKKRIESDKSHVSTGEF